MHVNWNKCLIVIAICLLVSSCGSSSGSAPSNSPDSNNSIETGNNPVTDDNENSTNGNAELPSGGAVTQLITGNSYSCAIYDSEVICWGEAPGSVPDLVNPTLLAGDYDNICAVDDLGTHCWGEHPSITPPDTVFQPTQIAVGYSSVCALESGRVTCWGNLSDTEIPNLDSPTQILVSGGGACAVDNGELVCWGDVYPYSAATLNEIGDGKIKEISFIAETVCITYKDLRPSKCLVDPKLLSLEDFLVLHSEVINDVVYTEDDSSTRFTDFYLLTMAAGFEGFRGTSLCRTKDGRPICSSYEFGYGTDLVPPQIKNASQVSSSVYHVCAIQDGRVGCWGVADSGALDVPASISITGILNNKFINAGLFPSENDVLLNSGQGFRFDRDGSVKVIDLPEKENFCDSIQYCSEILSLYSFSRYDINSEIYPVQIDLNENTVHEGVYQLIEDRLVMDFVLDGEECRVLASLSEEGSSYEYHGYLKLQYSVDNCFGKSDGSEAWLFTYSGGLLHRPTDWDFLEAGASHVNSLY